MWKDAVPLFAKPLKYANDKLGRNPPLIRKGLPQDSLNHELPLKQSDLYQLFRGRAVFVPERQTATCTSKGKVFLDIAGPTSSGAKTPTLCCFHRRPQVYVANAMHTKGQNLTREPDKEALSTAPSHRT